MKKPRIEGLDWLRGFMALSIMFYHLSDMTLTKNNPLDSGSVLGRLGIYGVSVFFVLSGLSIALVYHSFINSSSSAVKFFTRRIFRIWPLLWVACLLKILYSQYLVANATYSWQTVFINFTTLFGFVKEWKSKYHPIRGMTLR